MLPTAEGFLPTRMPQPSQQGFAKYLSESFNPSRCSSPAVQQLPPEVSSLAGVFLPADQGYSASSSSIPAGIPTPDRAGSGTTPSPCVTPARSKAGHHCPFLPGTGMDPGLALLLIPWAASHWRHAGHLLWLSEAAELPSGV